MWAKQAEPFKILDRPDDDIDHDNWRKTVATNNVTAVITKLRTTSPLYHKSVYSAPLNFLTISMPGFPSNTSYAVDIA